MSTQNAPVFFCLSYFFQQLWNPSKLQVKRLRSCQRNRLKVPVGCYGSRAPFFFHHLLEADFCIIVPQRFVPHSTDFFLHVEIPDFEDYRGFAPCGESSDLWSQGNLLYLSRSQWKSLTWCRVTKRVFLTYKTCSSLLNWTAHLPFLSVVLSLCFLQTLISLTHFLWLFSDWSSSFFFKGN